MNRGLPYNPESEELETITAGYVLASRVNDIVARPTSDRYTDYLQTVRGVFTGRILRDPQDQWRERAHKLMYRAIEAYEIKNGVKLTTHRLFTHPDQRLKIASVPHAIENDMAGLTFSIRETEKRLNVAIDKGVTAAMERRAQAEMLISGCHYWIYCEYWESAEEQRRVLKEHKPIVFDRRHALALEGEMIEFLAKTRVWQ